MKTLKECKDEIVQSIGYNNWAQFQRRIEDPKRDVLQKDEEIFFVNKITNAVSKLYASYIAEEVLKRAAEKVEVDLDGLEEPVFDSRDGDLIRARNEGIKLSNETACVTILNTEYKDLLK